MALQHEFSIIEKDYRGYEIDKNAEVVSISDDIILYIKDSLEWVNMIWNGKNINKGINYYGYSIIENEEIYKLVKIIETWKNLFYLAPNEFFITGCFCLDNQSYEQIFLEKNALLLELDTLIMLCKKAIKEDLNILHRGI